ncbi:MAG: beta-galactosidase [Ignisphaera sp.]
MLLLGAAHYPELWTSEVFAKDLELMKRIGLNVVRVAEFTWSLLEPIEGRYDFVWLHELVDSYGRNGTRVVLGTPTATPPPWLVKKYPDVLPVDFNGVPARYGVRREYCPNNPVYRTLTERIVRRLASEFRDDGNVIGFQIDNEVHWGEASSWRYCYCPYCIARFREYLRARYGDIDTLNKAMGTLVWSHRFTDFDEITPPKPPFDLYNRSLTIEWLRFRSLSWVEYVRFQASILKEVAPDKFVTTNLMGLYPEIDYYELCRDLDVCSTDVYPKFGADTYDPAFIALIYDATRNMSRNRRFIVMELQAGATDGYGYVSPEGIGVFKLGVSPEPGEIRKWVYQAVAHGAEGVLFWNWRTNCIGKEQFWHGILDHDGIPRRRFNEVEKVFSELYRIGKAVDGTSVEAKTALLLSYDSLWAADVIERGYYSHSYVGELIKAYKALWLNRVEVDVIPPNSTFESYGVIVAPFLYLADGGLVDRLREFVYRGGVLLLTPRAFTKDEYNRVRIDDTKIQELTGVKIKEYTRLPADSEALVKFTEWSPIMHGMTVRGSSWLEVYELVTANPIAYTKWSWLSDEPIVTLNTYGKGETIAIGTVLPQDVLTNLVKEILVFKNIAPIIHEDDYDPSIEYYARVMGTGKLIFIINHGATDRKAKFELKNITEVTDLLTDKKIEPGKIELPLRAHDVKILSVK